MDWIDVTKQLPELGRVVLVYGKPYQQADEQYGLGYLEKRRKYSYWLVQGSDQWGYFDDMEIRFDNDKTAKEYITHWMPLEPPW